MKALATLVSLTVGAALLLPVLTTPASADWWKRRGSSTIEGSGRVITESVDLDSFDAIRVESVANLYIRVGEEQTVEIEAEDNIIDLVDLYVRRGRLVVSMDDDHSINTEEGIRIHITMPKLTDLELEGVGSIEASNLDEEDLTVDVGGVGSVELEGSVDKLDLMVKGVGDVDLRDLTAQDARVRHSGVGNVRVRAERELDIRVSGVGSVKYYGNPKNPRLREDGLGSISSARR